MADGDELAGCFGAILTLALIAAAVTLAVMALMSVGAVFGAGTSLNNYYQAFRQNVQPERVPA